MSFWTDKRENLRGERIIAVPIILVMVLWFVFSAFVTIPAGHRGVVMQLGAVQDRILGEGFYTITPFVQSVQVMDIRTQKYEVQASAATKDLLDVSTTVAVNYHLDGAAVNNVFQTIGMDYESRVIVPAVQEVVKATTAEFDAQELIIERPTVKLRIETALRERLAERKITVEAISLTDFQFPAEFNAAIVSKQTAIQLKLKAINDLERIKVEAEQAVATATGQSQSIAIINEQLLKSPQYIQYLAVQKWNGVMPLATGGVMPLIQLPTASG